jgi:hypothetical protein
VVLGARSRGVVREVRGVFGVFGWTSRAKRTVAKAGKEVTNKRAECREATANYSNCLLEIGPQGNWGLIICFMSVPYHIKK